MTSRISLARDQTVDPFAGGRAHDLFVEQQGRVRTRLTYQRRVEGGIEPAICVAQVRALGDAPAQIKNARRLCDVEQAVHGWRDQRAVEVHDHGFAQYVIKCIWGDAGKLRQFGMRKFEVGIAAARFLEETVGGVKTFRQKSVGIEPGDLAPAAAADIAGPAASNEEARNS